MKRGYAVLETSLLGKIGVIVSEIGVEMVFLTEQALTEYLETYPDIEQDEGICHEAVRQLEEYFMGRRTSFDLPLVIEGTPFRKKVWQALREIPYGQTRSYGEIAQAIENPKAVRAVGSANKANALPIIIPCHRVIGASGKLVGFMGVRTDLQEKLLRHEEQYNRLFRL